MFIQSIIPVLIQYLKKNGSHLPCISPILNIGVMMNYNTSVMLAGIQKIRIREYVVYSF